MLTGALVTLAQRRAPNWSVQNIVDVLDEINRTMMSKELVSSIVYDTATGDFPALTTVAGTYVYEIKTPTFPSNAWKIASLLPSADSLPTEALNVATKEMFRASSSSMTYAQLTFHDDPGVATYYVQYYKAPTAIDTVGVQLDVPDRFHLSHVYPGVVSMIEYMTSGKSNSWDAFVTNLLPAFWAEMNKDSAHSDYLVTPVGY